MQRLVLVMVAALAASSAQAQTLYNQGPPLHRVVYRNTLSGRLNPLGLVDEFRLMYRLRLFESQSVALRDNFLGVGALAAVTPAYFSAGPYLEFQPLSVLGFWGTYVYTRYFRTFGSMQSFDSANADWSEREINRRRDLPKTDILTNYSTDGSQLILGVDFQVRVWQLVLRDRGRFVRGQFSLRAGDTVYYDGAYDVLAPNGGWFMANDVDLLWQRPDNKLVFGVRYTAATSFYTSKQYLAGEEMKNENATHKLGPFAGYTFIIEDGAAFNNVGVFLIAQWYLVSKYRAGVVTSQALPLVGIGVGFSGDLLPIKKKP